MAQRGRKPKPAFLRLVAGNPGKRPIVNDPAMNLDTNFDNGLKPPVKLGQRQQKLWRQFIRPCPWLGPLDAAKAYLWVELQAEFESAPQKMIAGKIAQLRAAGSELGLDVSSRQRLAASTPASSADDDPATKYLR